MAEKTRAPRSSQTTLKILNLLLRHFAHGVTPSDVAKSLGISPSLVTGHVNALEAEGFAERVPETGRIRPSVRLAQAATLILRDIEGAAARFNELQSRINTH
jgi:DNA-binding IclR family transcriptional regulator